MQAQGVGAKEALVVGGMVRGEKGGGCGTGKGVGGGESGDGTEGRKGG